MPRLPLMRWFVQALVVVTVLAMLAPVFYMIAMSFRTSAEIAEAPLACRKRSILEIMPRRWSK